MIGEVIGRLPKIVAEGVESESISGTSGVFTAVARAWLATGTLEFQGVMRDGVSAIRSPSKLTDDSRTLIERALSLKSESQTGK
jgi:hypothetical protein